jgi:chemotaxis protein MotB
MEQECPKCKPGLPPWLATFADLMSLLMCFFVLLLSFSEVDAIRFKKMAESMRDAFGVQREVTLNEIVKGVSVIKQEWSPSTAEPSVIAEIRQETSDVEKEHLEMQDQQQAQQLDQQQVMEAAEKALEEQMAEQAEVLKEALQEEIEQGMVTVASEGTMIILRIREKGSFPSGSASLDPGFHDVMARISKVLEDTPGDIVVAGHTDNVPISTGRFRSNWELSSARAVTVVHAMLRNKNIDPHRVLIEGWADTRPVAPNDTPENRALNRRVELVVRRGKAEDGGELTQ